MPLQDFELPLPENIQAADQTPTIVVAVLTCQRNHTLEKLLIEFTAPAGYVPGISHKTHLINSFLAVSNFGYLEP